MSDSRWCAGNLYNADHHISKYVIFLDENNDQLIMSIPGCGGTGKS